MFISAGLPLINEIMKRVTIIFLAVVLMFNANVFAQKTPAPVVKTFAKYKPPVLYTSIGKAKDSVGLSLADATALLSAPLIVTDAKKKMYTVTHYQFVYKKNVITENEAGKKFTNTAIVAQTFNDGKPLPELWRKTISGDLRPLEYLYFFDIIVKDDAGHVMYAPDVKIAVKE